jgi:two-component system nitrogen regulation response regulator GlnG
VTPLSVLIADDEPDMRWVLAGIFRDAGYETFEACDGQHALREAETHQPDVIVSDVRMPNLDGVALLRAIQARSPDIPVILLSAVEDIATAVDAIKQGAYDYLAKPFDPERLRVVVQRAAEKRRLRREVASLKGQLAAQRPSFGSSAAARRFEHALELVAPQTLTVLLVGESGTGKEVAAREIHFRSPRKDGPFVAVDCGALPETLMESHLFGHRRGAFTGADRDRPGLFRLAHGGTLFLDELGNLPLQLQAKLLRALQERTVTPVGGGDPVPFDARVLAATNVDLEAAVRRNEFRLDLYHRVAEFVIGIPPLRDRREDILHFAVRFLVESSAEMGRTVTSLTKAAEDALLARAWPGNLRELRNAIRRGVLQCSGPELDAFELGEPAPLGGGGAGSFDAPAAGGSLVEQIRQATTALEARILERTLAAVEGNKAAAARALQIDYTTLHRKLKRHGLLTMAQKP